MSDNKFQGLLAGKTGVIFGVAHKTSIAWGIAKKLHEAGMKLAFTYQGERLLDNVKKLVDEEMPGSLLIDCDVTDDAQVEAVFAKLDAEFGKLHTVVHSVAFAKKEDLAGGFIDTSRDGFLLAHNISAYSLTVVAKYAQPLLVKNGGGSIMTLTYLGGERVVKNYNVMGVAKASLEANVRYMAASLGPQGIRVNAVSAGAIRTLAASGIANFREMLAKGEEAAPMRKNVTIEQVGNAGAFLCSDLASGITGEILYVDGGYNIVGLAGI